MRISDWISDVCSSDLLFQFDHAPDLGTVEHVDDMTAMRKLHGRCIGVAIDGNRLDAIALQLDDDFLVEFAGAEQQHALGAGAQGGAKNRHHPSSETCFNDTADRSEEHTSELQSLIRNSYAVFCLKTKI